MVRIAPIVGLLAAGVAAAPTGESCPAPQPASTSSGSGCTSLSQTDFKWSVTGLQYNASIVFSTPAHQIDNAAIKFDISNPAFPGKPSSCSGYSTRPKDFFYGDQVFTCEASTTEGGLTTTFTYDAPTKMLALNQSWSCTDEQSAFSYVGTMDLSSELKCENEEYTNPNWSIGQDLSRNITTCVGSDFEWTPSTGSGVAK